MLNYMPEMPSDSEKKTADADSVEPPRIYIPACGALCDIFWWARPDPAAEREPVPISSSGKRETE
jgi:hypothetical protein